MEWVQGSRILECFQIQFQKNVLDFPQFQMLLRPPKAAEKEKAPKAEMNGAHPKTGPVMKVLFGTNSGSSHLEERLMVALKVFGLKHTTRERGYHSIAIQNVCYILLYIVFLKTWKLTDPFSLDWTSLYHVLEPARGFGH